MSRPRMLPVLDTEEAPPSSPPPRRLRQGRRSPTIAPKAAAREREVARAAGAAVDDYDRPSSRADCLLDDRPCPWVGCKHHLYLDVNPESGSIKLNFPDLEVWELAETCALDVADQGGITLENVGELLNITRERVRQVEVRALIKSSMAARLQTDLDGSDIAPDVAGADYED